MTPADKPTKATGPAHGTRSLDDRMRDHGMVIVTRLLATIRTGRAYKVGNQVLTRQLESFIESVLQVIGETGEAVFVTLEGDLYLNGARLPVKANNLRFHESVRKEFETRKIAGFRATRGVNLKEVEAFFEMFMQPEEYAGAMFLAACHQRGLAHLQPVVHATAQAPSESERPAEGARAVIDTDGAADAAATPAGATGLIGEESSSGWAIDRGAQKKVFQLALQGMRTLLQQPSDGVQLRHAKRVVQPLVDGAFASEPVVVGLAGLTDHDDYTYAHAVNVALVAVNIGQVLGFDRRQLADLGVAVLLHDCGKSAVAKEIEHPLEEFTAAERVAAERHPVEGAKIIARSSVLNQTTLRCMRVALEHHMSPGGTGYPHTESPWGPSLLSRVTSVADCYVNLLTHRGERGKNMTPHKALSIMFGPLQDRFDLAGLWALVQVVGFYPPGQMVKLDDDSVAVVISNNRQDPAHPHLRLVLHPNGRGVKANENIEFRPLPPERSIKRALRAKEYLDDLGASSEEENAA
jgi:HD-GYP domain-containing protein (c-di-GMP phosphodiesterase class II)